MSCWGNAVQLTGPSGGGSTLSVPGSGVKLERIIIGTFVASSVVTVYNGIDATGTVIATIDAASTGLSRNIPFSCILKKGLFVTVTGGAAKVTVVYE